MIKTTFIDFKYVSAKPEEVVILYNHRTKVKRYLTGDFAFLFDPAWEIMDTIPSKPMKVTGITVQEVSKDGVDIDVSYEFLVDRIIGKIEETLWSYEQLIYLTRKEIKYQIKNNPSYISKNILSENIMKRLKPKFKELEWILKSFSIPYKEQ